MIRAEADGHETQPPPRYTEATLVKAMEEKGIGRPSTYASIIGTIQDRGYVGTRGNALVPTWLAFAVTRLLEEHFPRLVDYDFTASMEEDLDRIANGDEQRVAWLERFYFGDEAGSAEGLKQLVDDLGEIDAREISTIQLGDGMVVRVGRYGPYVEEVTPAGVDARTGEVLLDEAPAVPETPRRATINDDIAPDEMTPAKARELLDAAADDGRVLGLDPVVRQRDHRQGRVATGPTSPRCCRRPRPTTRHPSAARPQRRPSRVPRRCSRTWTSRRSTSTPRCSCSRCRAWSGRSPRRTARRSTSPHRTDATGPTSRRAPTRGRW